MKIRIDPGDVIVEMLSIVVAILLALAVNNWQQNVKQQRDLRVNVTNIVNELAFNQRQLAGVLPRHEREAAAIRKELAADLGTHEQLSLDGFYYLFKRVAPRGIGVAHLQQAAWQIAQTDPSFAIMPPDERLLLARLYTEQTFLTQIYERLLTHIPAAQEPSYFPNLVALSLDFADANVAEQELRKAYAVMIPRLRKAYGVPAGGTPTSFVQD